MLRLSASLKFGALALLPGLATAETLSVTPTAAIAPTQIALTRHKAGTFYAPALIDGYGEVSLLVDTGSSYLVINEEILTVLKKAGAARYSRELDGRMADGSRRVIPVYRLSGLRLGEHCWVGDVEAAVFASAVRPILGMNILSQLAPFTFSAEPPQLGLHRCDAAEAEADVAAMPAAETAAPLAP